MRTLASILLIATGAALLHAQNAPKPPAAPAGPAPTLKAFFLNQLADSEKKLVSLAEAMPAEKFSWRPADGVRSISEVFMHEAGANYLFMTFLGAKPPAGFNRDSEKTVTDKAQVVQMLKDSFAHVRQAVSGLSDADMTKETKMFGRPQTNQNVLFVYSNHLHEHLGQAIAYARQNGIVPPWSAKES
jgi:uncharacterized damage-inducible protein DinB